MLFHEGAASRREPTAAEGVVRGQG